MKTVTIPVMAKSHRPFAEAEVLQAWKSLHRRKRSADAADEENHVWKHDLRVPFVCGARIWAKHCAHSRRRGHDSHQKGEAGSGNVVEAVRHMRTIVSQMKRLTYHARR